MLVNEQIQRTEQLTDCTKAEGLTFVPRKGVDRRVGQNVGFCVWQLAVAVALQSIRDSLEAEHTPTATVTAYDSPRHHRDRACGEARPGGDPNIFPSAVTSRPGDVRSPKGICVGTFSSRVLVEGAGDADSRRPSGGRGRGRRSRGRLCAARLFAPREGELPLRPLRRNGSLKPRGDRTPSRCTRPRRRARTRPATRRRAVHEWRRLPRLQREQPIRAARGVLACNDLVAVGGPALREVEPSGRDERASCRCEERLAETCDALAR